MTVGQLPMTASGHMRQILIVDDSPTIRQAIERLALGAIGLMVLDLNMPDMHGLEVLGFVRSHQKYRNVPIVVLTTRGDEASRSAALQAGATAYLTKPFAPHALATEVRQLLGASDSQAPTGRSA
jgi:two-component system chemotaxis response regulator CheY